MNARRTIQLGAFAPLLLAASVSWGAAFSISEWGARGLGMGNAVTAFGDDPSAIVFNPAGLVQFIQSQPGTVKLRPDQKLVYRRNWETAAQRMRGVRRLLDQLAKLATRQAA